MIPDATTKKSERLVPSDLSPSAVVPTPLDNQWVPRDELRHILATGKSRKDFAKNLDSLARAEYRRALLNSRQVILNRAFLWNNPIVSADFAQPDKNRAAFIELLTDDTPAIVPYLYNEPDPVTPPPSFALKDAGKAFDQWCAIARESRPRCLRLSWDDRQNAELTQRSLARRFHDMVVAIESLNPAELSAEIDLTPSLRRDFFNLAHEVSRFCSDFTHRRRLEIEDAGKGGSLYTARDDIYGRFLVEPQQSPEDLKQAITDGKYARGKPIIGPIKHLVDLVYSTGLSDAVQCQALTAHNSPRRSALQEIRALLPANKISAEDMLRNLAQAQFEFIQEKVRLPRLEVLELDDVLALRRDDSWKNYISAMEGMLRNPLNFGDPNSGLPAVLREFQEFSNTATTRVAGKVGGRAIDVADGVIEAVEIVLAVGGYHVATLVIKGVMGTIKILRKFPAFDRVAETTQTLTGRMVLRLSTGGRDDDSEELGTQFLNHRISDARQFLMQLEAKGGFKVERENALLASEQADISHAGSEEADVT